MPPMPVPLVTPLTRPPTSTRRPARTPCRWQVRLTTLRVRTGHGPPAPAVMRRPRGAGSCARRCGRRRGGHPTRGSGAHGRGGGVGAGRRRPPAGAGGHGHRQVARVPRTGDAARHERRPRSWWRRRPGAAAPARRARPAPRRRRARAGARPPADVRGAEGPPQLPCLDRLHRGAAARPTTRRPCSPRPPPRSAGTAEGCASGPTTPRPATATTCRSASTERVWRALSVRGASASARRSARTARSASPSRPRQGRGARGRRHQPRDARDPRARGRPGAARARRRRRRRGPRARRPGDPGGHRRAAGRDGRARRAARPQPSRISARPARVRGRGRSQSSPRAPRAGGRASSRSRAGCCWRSPPSATPRHAAIGAIHSDAGRSEGRPRGARRAQRARACWARSTTSPGALLSPRRDDVAWLDRGTSRRAPVLRVAPLAVAGLLRTALFDSVARGGDERDDDSSAGRSSRSRARSACPLDGTRGRGRVDGPRCRIAVRPCAARDPVRRQHSAAARARRH